MAIGRRSRGGLPPFEKRRRGFGAHGLAGERQAWGSPNRWTPAGRALGSSAGAQQQGGFVAAKSTAFAPVANSALDFEQGNPVVAARGQQGPDGPTAGWRWSS